jgi:cytosine/adenosine deaminase-related metal-dependent hydrolase
MLATPIPAVLSDGEQAQQAVVTVQNLEARAQAHADITTQAVAQARHHQGQAQAHAQEQAKAIAQATVLHAHAQSLHASAQQIEQQAQPELAAVSRVLRNLDESTRRLVAS